MGRPGQGSWRLTLPRQADFDDLEHWVRLARTLERGRFDVFFLSDVIAQPVGRGVPRRDLQALGRLLGRGRAASGRPGRP
jgi:alkanesulfonate monooxygenase SsuD/methylene tetrahydromethanopterin reductase-like flavin-dependent oxidoreductase (luciferase family)